MRLPAPPPNGKTPYGSLQQPSQNTVGARLEKLAGSLLTKPQAKSAGERVADVQEPAPPPPSGTQDMSKLTPGGPIFNARQAAGSSISAYLKQAAPAEAPAEGTRIKIAF